LFLLCIAGTLLFRGRVQRIGEVSGRLNVVCSSSVLFGSADGSESSSVGTVARGCSCEVGVGSLSFVQLVSFLSL